MGILSIASGILEQGFIFGIMALGIYITYKILDFPDLSVDGTFPLGAILSGILIMKGVNPWLCLLIAFAVGMLAGTVTGLLHVKLKIRPLLCGILIYTGCLSINLVMLLKGTGGKAIATFFNKDTIFNSSFGALIPESIGGYYLRTTIVSFILVIICKVLLDLYLKTKSGLLLRATGDNARMARAQGVNTDAMKILGLVLSNGLVALSGGLIAQSQTFADIQMGTGSIVIGLASLIIGEVLFGKKTFSQSLRSLVFGAICYRLIIALVLKLGMPANDLKLFTALTVAVALSLPTLKQKAQARKAAREEARQCLK